MYAETERQVPPRVRAMNVECVGVLKYRRIMISSAIDDDDVFVGFQGDAVDLDDLPCTPVLGLQRTVESQRFLDGVAGQIGVGTHRLVGVRVSQQRAKEVTKLACCGVYPRTEQKHKRVEDLFLAQGFILLTRLQQAFDDPALSDV